MQPEPKTAALDQLIAEYRSDASITAVFLFGSHARGTQRPDSDIDLLVIRAGAFERTVFESSGVEFEVFRNNEADTITFWQRNLDDFENFWRDARPLLDHEGAVARLRAAADRIRSNIG